MTMVETVASEAGGFAVKVGIPGPSGDSLVLSGTSATSNSISLGSKVFETQTGKSFHPGTWVSIVSRANSGNRMHGLITDYDDGDLTVDVQRTAGAGTFDDWDIHVTGALGAAGEAGPTNNVFATRQALGDVEVEASVKGAIVQGLDQIGVGGGLYLRVAEEPSHSAKVRSEDRFLPDGTEDEDDGGWWELKDDNGTIYPTQFGAVAHTYTSSGEIQSSEGTLTDSFPAWEAMQEYMIAKSVGTQIPTIIGSVAEGSGRRTGFRIFWPPGLYYFSDSWEIKDVIQIHEASGNSSQSGPGAGVVLIWARDKVGIRVNYHRTRGIPGTLEDTEEGSYTGQGSGIIGFTLRSYGGGAGAADGIQIRAPFFVRDCVICNFGQDGININAQAITSTDAIRGNGNLFELYNILVTANGRCGVYCDAADSNAGMGIHVAANNNGKYGIWDSSFLGNTWIACHTISNGLMNVGQIFSGENNTTSNMVSHGGNRYVVMYGQEVAASTTTPGTDTSVWQFVSAGGVAGFAPAWVSGTTYQHGANYIVEGGSQFSTLIGCYSEGGSSPNVFGAQVMVIGGTLAGPGQHASGATNPPGRLVPSAGFIQSGAGWKTRYQDPLTLNFRTITFGGGLATGDFLTYQDDVSAPSTYKLQVNNTTGDVTWNYGSNSVPFTISGPNTALTHGRASPVTNGIWFRFIWFGALGFGRHITNAAAAPSSGEWARGDLIFRQSPSAAGKIGWVCTTGGTAGSTAVFKEWGVIDP